ncbi:MAG: hypothetical protein QM820_45105 [Minicystis sp.]
MAEHDYYRVHFVCQPGGSRKTEYHVVGTLEEVKEAVAADLNSPEGAYHALIYGEEIFVQQWFDGRLVKRVDLLPFITYRLSDREEPVRFGDDGEPPLDIDDEEISNGIMDEEITVAATVDWDRVPLLPPQGTSLPHGTAAPFERGEPWTYGFHGEWDVYVR